MMRMISHKLYTVWLTLLLLFLASCANPGSGPDGGPFDETPPRILSMSPALGAVGSTPRRIEILFNENIKVENAAERVIISPPSPDPPEISVSGKRIRISLPDTLVPNTTYTIDFSDAIADNNEGNPLGAFTYYFTTGEVLDTMEISGHVIDAETLTPLKGLLVGLYVEDVDTLQGDTAHTDPFTTHAFSRVARTDEKGFFSIKGVRNGTYRLYALKDVDGDYHFTSRAEMMAWSDELFTTSCYQDIRRDTVWRDSVTWDSIREIPYTHYVPDNAILRAFTHANKPRHLLKTQRDVPEWFRVYFTGPSAFLPQIQGLNFSEYDAFVVDANTAGDTITYWLKDTTLLRQDTLQFLFTYYETDDSTGIDTLRTDTLALHPRLSFAKRAKQQQDDLTRWERDRDRRHRRGDYSNEVPPRDFLKIEVHTAGSISPIDNPTIIFPQPPLSINYSGIHLLLGPDSLQTEARYELIPSPRSKLSYTLRGEWRPGQQYTLVIDSAAVVGLNGVENKSMKQRFRIADTEEFGSLFVTLINADTTYVVQLIQDDKRVLQTVRVGRDGQADFFYLRPGKAYLRAFVDSNHNGIWDTGDYAAGIQPEQMTYYHKQIDLRAGWDTEVTWQPNDLPPLQQKPDELRSGGNTQSQQRGAHERNIERNRQRRN